ncbi:MAG: hypothetical protein P1V34_07680 [Alphaproteobacteria bacterium]|nr:hypothetical protein [Alphaproteobacteria bacterium]
MTFEPKDPPRLFHVGDKGQIELQDCGSVYLAPDQQVTFRSTGQNQTAFDVTRKDFGYYVCNSMNGTLPRQGLRPALCRNTAHKLLYLLLVEPEHQAAFMRYLSQTGMELIAWIDNLDETALNALADSQA